MPRVPAPIEMRMMARSGYDKPYAAALSAATAVIGPIIPPSIIMVIYALTDSRVTVAGLFLAGVVPGLLMGLALMAMNHWISVRRGYGSAHPPMRWSSAGRAVAGATGAGDAGDHHRRHPERPVHADRGFGGGGLLRAVHRPCSSPAR